MRAKRRRVSSQCRQDTQRRKDTRCMLDTLPPEILGIILRMLSLHDVACVVRLVSRRWSDIAATVLNSEFLIAGTKLEIAMKRVKGLMNSTKTDTELHEYGRIFNAVELIWSQYQMLKAVTWRYTHPRSRGSPISCFYGGRVLDSLNRLQAELQTGFALPCRRSSNILDYVNLQIFMRVCEHFMDHFERITERRMNKSALVSGCKIVDLLDCLAEGRELLSFRTLSRGDSSMVCMQLKYVLKHTWFTCLRVPNTNDEQCWQNKQRYMYLRLRRLVSCFNKHFFCNLHYERKLVLRAIVRTPQYALVPSSLHRRLVPPPASTYSGYGEYGGQFFYYGNMSNCAYKNRFKRTRNGNAGNTDTELEEEIDRSHQFDLVIKVELRCSPELAPLATEVNLNSDDLDDYSIDSRQELYLRLSTKCAASKTNRLPSCFVWEVRDLRQSRLQYC